MTNVGKDSAETGSMLGAREQCGVFSFPGAGNDARDNCREGVDGAIDFKWLMVISEEKVTASDGTGVRARKVESVDVAMKDHVAVVISDRVVGVGSGIREGAIGCLENALSRASLLGYDFICNREKGRVHGTCVIEQGAYDGLDFGALFRR